ncbi:MAG: hypothetical protein Q8Q90_02285 [bacterium]|nr:hypothetical protein [bacterium]
MKKFQDLYDFIDRAIKSRKYPDNTGMSLKTALKLFEVELNDEERSSIGEFKKNLEQIYQNVFSKNKNFTASSLATYKSRVLKVLADYEKYGVELTKMANWFPKVIIRSKKQSDHTSSNNRRINSNSSIEIDGSFHSFDFTGGVKLLIPKTKEFTEAIMDGGLKQIKIELKSFSDKYFKKEDL